MKWEEMTAWQQATIVVNYLVALDIFIVFWLVYNKNNSMYNVVQWFKVRHSFVFLLWPILLIAMNVSWFVEY